MPSTPDTCLATTYLLDSKVASAMSRQSRGPTVYELLSKPFGPFLDSIILSPECKTTPQKPVELKDVLLLLDDDEPTG